jgi:hypothetical protein
MGIGNFFDNFMGGLAFGMAAGLPSLIFGRGYGCCGSFPMMGGFGYQSNQFDYMFDESYKNSFPQIDYTAACQSIWDLAKKRTEDYFKQLQESSANSSIPLNNCNCYMPQFTMPFSGYYFSTYQSPYFSGYTQTQVTQTKPAEKVQSLEPEETDAETKKKDKAEYTTSREFASIYQDLGITDKRFQKIFEECVLSLNEGRKNGEDYYIFDVKAMNKNGVLQPTYDDYRVKVKHLPKRDVKNMTLKEMCEIYYTMYYVEGGAKDIKDDRLALYVFDSDVNMGVGTGKTLLARSGNNAKKFEEERRKEYQNRKGFSKYKNTWYDRITNTKKYADSNFSTVA